MRVLVLGAGVIGVTTAHALWRDGHDVTVIDRAAGPAQETSLGNAGGICPGFAGPWARPGAPTAFLSKVLAGDPTLSLRLRADPEQWRWLMAFLGECTPARFQANKAAMQRIAHHGLHCLKALRAELPLAYDGGQGGVLQIFRDATQCAGGVAAASVLNKLGIAHALLDRAGVLAREPALAWADIQVAGGLHLPGDETGDCHAFTTGLANTLTQAGVAFHFGATVTGLILEAGRCIGARLDDGVEMRADAVVVALGPWAHALLRTAGMRLPIQPVQGCSLTIKLPPGEEDAAPRSSIMDEQSKIMLTRLGNRVRVAGMARVAGFEHGLDPRAAAALRRTTAAILPGLSGVDRAEVWHGFRAMTPDGPPILGPSGIAGLHLNVGQGSNGWTQACGCARVVADLLAARDPGIDITGLTWPRPYCFSR